MHIHTFIRQTESYNWHVCIQQRLGMGEIFLSTTEFVFIRTVTLQVERDNLLSKLQSGALKGFMLGREKNP